MYTINLSGRTAIVTGGGRGIGREIVLHLAKAGANVVIANRDEKAASETANFVIQQGGHALAVTCDVLVTSQIDDMVKKSQSKFGEIDIIVANAGVGTRALIGETSNEEYARVFDTVVRHFMGLARSTVPGMKERKFGRVIAISSSTGRSGKAFQSASPTYAGAKAGLIGYVRGLARECGPYGVTVNAVCPGWIDWGVKHDNAPVQVRASALAEIPMQRTGRAEEVASAVTYLASDSASYITGICLDVNGGLYMG